MFKTGKRETLCPVVGMILNLPPRMRTTFGALLLLGVMPPKIRNYKVMFQFLLRQLQPALRGPGILVRDSSIDKDIMLKIEIVAIVEDSRGLKNPLCCKQSPAIVGGCPYCAVVGLRGCGTTAYVSAISSLRRVQERAFSQQNEIIKRKFKRSFAHWPEVLEKADLPPPKTTTVKDALLSARRVMRGEKYIIYLFLNLF